MVVKNWSDNNNMITWELKWPLNCLLIFQSLTNSFVNLEPLQLLPLGRNGLSNLKAQLDTDLMLTKNCGFLAEKPFCLKLLKKFK